MRNIKTQENKTSSVMTNNLLMKCGSYMYL